MLPYTSSSSRPWIGHGTFLDQDFSRRLSATFVSTVGEVINQESVPQLTRLTLHGRDDYRPKELRQLASHSQRCCRGSRLKSIRISAESCASAIIPHQCWYAHYHLWQFPFRALSSVLDQKLRARNLVNIQNSRSAQRYSLKVT